MAAWNFWLLETRYSLFSDCLNCVSMRVLVSFEWWKFLQKRWKRVCMGQRRICRLPWAREFLNEVLLQPFVLPIEKLFGGRPCSKRLSNGPNSNKYSRKFLSRDICWFTLTCGLNRPVSDWLNGFGRFLWNLNRNTWRLGFDWLANPRQARSRFQISRNVDRASQIKNDYWALNIQFSRLARWCQRPLWRTRLNLFNHFNSFAAYSM